MHTPEILNTLYLFIHITGSPQKTTLAAWGRSFVLIVLGGDVWQA